MGATASRRLFLRVPGFGIGFFLMQGLVDEHFEIGLIAESVVRGLGTSPGDVFGIEPNGGSRGASFARRCAAPIVAR